MICLLVTVVFGGYTADADNLCLQDVEAHKKHHESSKCQKKLKKEMETSVAQFLHE